IAFLIALLPASATQARAVELPLDVAAAASRGPTRSITDATGLTFSVLESYIRRRIISTRPPYGLKIRSVTGESPAHRAGLRPGDVLLTWNGQPIRSPRQLRGWIAASQPSQPIELGYARLRADRTIWSRSPWAEMKTSLTLPVAR
ncbi:MAG: PDZ domain-containing protein, partial [Planctomycetota bacterium]